jgi:hypothetical protein
VSLSCTPKASFTPGMHLSYVDPCSFFNRSMIYSRINDIKDNKCVYHSTLNQKVKKIPIQSTLYTAELSTAMWRDC